MADGAEGNCQLEFDVPALPGEKGFDPSLATGMARLFVGFEQQGRLLVRGGAPEQFRVS